MNSNRVIAFNDLPRVQWHDAIAHVYRHHLSDMTPCHPLAFNPLSRGRLACLTRAMYYAGSSANCALWECPPLRNVVGVKNHTVPLLAAQFERMRLVWARPTRPCQLVDLSDAGLRALVGTLDDLEFMRELLRTDQHARTHALAQQLLDTAVNRDIPVDGFIWRSKQFPEDRVLLFFQPPMQSDLFEVTGDPQPLDDNDLGWSLVDAALAAMGMKRLTADGVVGERIGN